LLITLTGMLDRPWVVITVAGQNKTFLALGRRYPNGDNFFFMKINFTQLYVPLNLKSSDYRNQLLYITQL